jgi:hypothetical protein
MNASFYASHPIFEQQHNKGAFSCTSNAFAMSLSDIALDALKKDDPSTAVIAEAFNNSTSGVRFYVCFHCPVSSNFLLSHIFQPLLTKILQKKDQILFHVCLTVPFFLVNLVISLWLKRFISSDVL